ncbi:MAG: SDR family oxidoreductase [Planctomycetota bacterium]|nr:SDR family oxidoreductase [Planctomycetota bacterium]
MPGPDPLDLTGRVAWVTGAARGIGLACVRALALHGARVVGLDLKLSPELLAVAPDSRELNVADPAAVAQVAAALAEAGLAPEILVNNAGITRDGVLWKLSPQEWSSVLDVNLTGAFHLMHEAVPLMRACGRGSVVNITSINGERGKFGQSNYSAAKAGLIGLTKAAAREAGRFGIRVNAVAPGMVETEMAEKLPPEVKQRAVDESVLGRIAQPGDVANCVLFLASSLAAHITGQVIRVDGGQYI